MWVNGCYWFRTEPTKTRLKVCLEDRTLKRHAIWLLLFFCVGQNQDQIKMLFMISYDATFIIVQVGAVDENEMLTPLGHHLAKLPVDLLLGKV